MNCEQLKTGSMIMMMFNLFMFS